MGGAAYAVRMSTPLPAAPHPLMRLLELPGVAEGVDAAREACTRLRWHEAMRRRADECAVESRVQGAHASAALEGAEWPVDWVREAMAGVRPWSEDPDPVEPVVRGAVRATEEAAHLESLTASAPSQVLARLHLAAVRGVVADVDAGRPRHAGEPVRELTELGDPPPAEAVAPRLTGLTQVLTAPPEVPAVLVAAVAHAEVAVVRPFVRGNGLVARALERAVVRSRGLDPLGVAVVEAGHRPGGGVEYHGALAAYAGGTPEGVALWLRHAAESLEGAVRAGERVADAVRSGRVPQAG